MRRSFSISEFKFEQAYGFVKAVVFINNLLFSIFVLRGLDYIVTHPYTLFSLFSSLLILLVFKIYDWRSSTINFGVILLYLSLLICEFGVFGLPESLMSMQAGFLSQYILMEFAMDLLPYVYFIIRSFASFYLIPIWWHSRNFR